MAACRQLEPLPPSQILRENIKMTQIEMDEIRELLWNFQAIKRFEGAAKVLLRRNGVATAPEHNARTILVNYGILADILEVSVGAATGLSWQEKDDMPSEAAVAIDAYLKKQPENGLETLNKAVYRAFLEQANPSGIATLEIDEENDLKGKIERLERLTASYRSQLKSGKKKKSQTSGEPATT